MVFCLLIVLNHKTWWFNDKMCLCQQREIINLIFNFAIFILLCICLLGHYLQNSTYLNLLSYKAKWLLADIKANTAIDFGKPIIWISSIYINQRPSKTHKIVPTQTQNASNEISKYFINHKSMIHILFINIINIR